MKFKKSEEGRAINIYLDELQKKFTTFIFVRRVPEAPTWTVIWTGTTTSKAILGMPPCLHWRDNKPCICEQQGRRKLYRLIKYCFQGKRTLADLVHYALWNTKLADKPFVLLGMIEVIKRLRATCQNLGNLV